MLPFGLIGLACFIVIALGARKVWLFVERGLSKLFSHEAAIKRITWAVIGMTMLLMLSPFIGWAHSPVLRMIVLGLYGLYGLLGLVQIYDWFNGENGEKK